MTAPIELESNKSSKKLSKKKKNSVRKIQHSLS